MKKLKEGDSIIHFKALDLNGNMVDLKKFEGKKVFITFFRKAACPFCNMSLQELINNHKTLEEDGVEIISFFASPKDEVLKYAGKQNPPFPIIPDGDFKIYAQYGVDVSYIGMFKSMFNPVKVFKAMTGGFFSLRSTTQDPVLPANFLIDENQEIHTAYYGKDYDDHIPISDVLAWAK